MESTSIIQSSKGIKSCEEVGNDHTPPLSYPSLGKYKFMPLLDQRFGNQDCQLVQPHQTCTYVRVLQYWAEKSQLPILAESVLELWWVMKPLVTFTEVLVATAPSNWVEVSSPRLAEPTPADPHCSCSHSHSHNTQAHPRGPYWQPMADINQLALRKEISLLLCPDR